MPRTHLIGVDLGGTNVRAAAVRDGQLGDVHAIPVDPRGSVEQVLEQLCALIERTAPGDAAGIGIGVPGLVDVGRGIVYDVVNIPSWKAVPLKSILEERYGVPVLVNNDANCFALGEKHFGKGRDHASLIGLIVGTGFAAGVIIDGRLYAGANCGAGEVGMMPYRDGIYEHYCAGLFFPRRAGQTGTELYAKAERGDQEALAIFAEFGQHLGEGIKAVLYAYDPGLIVMGGSVRKAFRYFERAMWESIRTFAYENSLASLTIERSDLEHVAVLGAAALHLDAELAGG